MNIHHIASYKFIPLTDLPRLKNQLLDTCISLNLKGTILLSQEGINLALAAEKEAVESFKITIKSDNRFHDLSYRESFSEQPPFKHMKVKIKKEIITMRQEQVRPEKQSAPRLSPKELKQWLDEKRKMTLIDTRNDYEVKFGTFEGAVNLQLQDFSEFPEASQQISKINPIVMFCTGGIRCEKAALHLLDLGFKDVFQLEGGILNYFKETQGEYFHGDCFVFDQRIAVGHDLKPTGTIQCLGCQGPISVGSSCSICKG